VYYRYVCMTAPDSC